MDGGESVVCVCVISWRRRAGICGMASLPSPLSYQLIQSALKAAAAKQGRKTLLQYTVAQGFAKFKFYQSI